MPDAVTISGDDRAASMLRELGRKATQQYDTMLVAARQTQRAISGIPVNTGRLERGVTGGAESTLDVTESGFDVGTDVSYGRFVFNGTRYMRARPPRVPEIATRVATAVSNDLA
jgi:hypothetical protein